MDESLYLDLQQLGNKLHQRLLGGDVTASAEVADVFLDVVIRTLRKRIGTIHDYQLVDDAVETAVLSYIKRPGQYDPSQLSLERYLLMSARWDLLKLLRKSQYRGFPKEMEYVELDDPDREPYVEPVDHSLGVEEQLALSQSLVWSTITHILTDPVDQELALMILEGIRETDGFAALLKIQDFPVAEREAEVKRHKDRIKKMLKRHIDRSSLEDPL